MSVTPERPGGLSTYRTVWSLSEWKACLDRAAGSQYVGLDFETKPDGAQTQAVSGLRAEEGSEICGIGVAWIEDGRIESAYVGIRHDRRFAGGPQPRASEITAALSDFIRDRPPGFGIVTANVAMELSFMLAEGIVWPPDGDIHDVQVAARVLNRGVGPFELIGLKPLAAAELGRTMESKSDLDRWLSSHGFKPGQDIWHSPVAVCAQYCQDDARDALALMMKWKDHIVQPPTRWWWTRPPDRSSRKDLYELEMKVAIDALMVGLRGTRIDATLAKRRSLAARIIQNVVTRWLQERLEMPVLNPGSQTQLRGILFGSFEMEVNPEHMTESWAKLQERQQIAAEAKGGPDYYKFASLDVDALDYYASVYPDKSDVLFMLAVYRKCQTAISWFEDRVDTYGCGLTLDPWWKYGEGKRLFSLVFHRLKTVGTRGGRMSSADFNAQQVPKRMKMLIAADRLFDLLREFLPQSQYEELRSWVDLAVAQPGDEAKAAHVAPGASVIDFSVRRMFIPREGYVMRDFDLSQVEMKGFAHFSGNRSLCDGYGAPLTDDQVATELAAIRRLIDTGEWPEDVDWDRHRRLEESPFDIHANIGARIKLDRRAGKTMNFAILYGMGKRKLARSMNWSTDDARKFFSRYHSELPEIMELQTRIKTALKKRGYIFDPFGRRYHLPLNKSYVGLNRLIQGWAAGVFKMGFARICDVFVALGDKVVHPITRRMMQTGPRILTCVHDENLGEIPIHLNTPKLDWVVRSCMTCVFGLKVPLSTSSESSAVSWDDMEDFGEAK